MPMVGSAPWPTALPCWRSARNWPVPACRTVCHPTTWSKCLNRFQNFEWKKNLKTYLYCENTWKHHNSIRLKRELIDFKSHWASSLVICADFACTSVSNCEIRCKSCSCSYCQNLPGNIMVTVLFTWRPGMVEILKPARNKLLGEAGCWLSMLQKKWTNPDKLSSKTNIPGMIQSQLTSTDQLIKTEVIRRSYCMNPWVSTQEFAVAAYWFASPCKNDSGIAKNLSVCSGHLLFWSILRIFLILFASSKLNSITIHDSHLYICSQLRRPFVIRQRSCKFRAPSNCSFSSQISCKKINRTRRGFSPTQTCNLSQLTWVRYQ